MTLTVVDGDFPRELLARQNLTFAEYNMPAKRNSPESYDAKLNKPAPKKQGILKVGALIQVGDDTSVVEVAPSSAPNLPSGLLVSILIAAIGGAIAFRVKFRKTQSDSHIGLNSKDSNLVARSGESGGT